MKYYNFISGGMTPQHLLAALSFAAMGWILFKAFTGITRVKASTRSPRHWSWSFWIKDNWKQAFTHAILMFILVRFAAEILAKTGVSAEIIESEDPMWIYFVVGVAKSWILDVVKKRNSKG
jgi:hypothetical protein